MDQESSNQLCKLEGGLQRAARAGHAGEGIPLFSTPSSFLEASGSYSRFAGEGGTTPSSEERRPHLEGDSRQLPLSQMHQRGWTLKAKEKLNLG